MLTDPIVLARIQFAANISFHILFPTISIALSWVLVFFKFRLNRTNNPAWRAAYAFWVKIFALTFALGVVSGVTMSFQFGTNWPGFMETVGNVAGPLLAYEVLTAFFLEATFLGIMLFGQKRVSRRIHTLATLLVAIGTTFSAFWILALNSWMQTPSGVEMIDGRVHVLNWWDVIFNPTMPYQFSHMLVASGLTIGFLLAGISAYRRLKGDLSENNTLELKTGIYLAAFLIPLQIYIGDLHGLNTLKHQPAKIAAIEAIWHTERSVALNLFALPNERTRQNDYAISVPKLGSLILTHDIDGEIKGLNEFVDLHPPVAKVFWSFRIMVGVGILMLLVSWPCTWTLLRGKTLSTLKNRLLVAMTFSGWIAVLSGWYVAEIGRQPWLVTDILKTADAASKVPVNMIATTLFMYLALYAFLLLSYVSVVFYLAGLALKKPTHTEGAIS